MKRRFVVFAMIASIGAVAALSPHASATMIVFDPTNYGKNVEQLQQDLQMVQQLKAQVENQLKMIQSWGFTDISGIMQSMNRWQSVLQQAVEKYQSNAQESELHQQYPEQPENWQSTTQAQMLAVRQQWEADHRQAIVENRNIQNAIVQDMQPTAQRVQQYVDQSNNAVGTTAAIQAGNEILATHIAQIQALEALEASQARLESEQEAQEQAEAAYAEDQRQKVHGTTWDHPTKTTSPAMYAFE